MSEDFKRNFGYWSPPAIYGMSLNDNLHGNEKGPNGCTSAECDRILHETPYNPKANSKYLTLGPHDDFNEGPGGRVSERRAVLLAKEAKEKADSGGDDVESAIKDDYFGGPGKTVEDYRLAFERANKPSNDTSAHDCEEGCGKSVEQYRKDMAKKLSAKHKQVECTGACGRTLDEYVKIYQAKHGKTHAVGIGLNVKKDHSEGFGHNVTWYRTQYLKAHATDNMDDHDSGPGHGVPWYRTKYIKEHKKQQAKAKKHMADLRAQAKRHIAEKKARAKASRSLF